MKRAGIEVKYVLVCDDARTEDNGKHIIIGLYNDAIVLPEGVNDVVAPITFFIMASLPRGKEVSISTWLESPTGERMQETDWSGLRLPDDLDNSLVQIVWRLFPWRSRGLGKYKLHMTTGNHDSIIHEFDVRHRDQLVSISPR